MEKNKELASELAEYQKQLAIANKRLHETEETRAQNDRLQTQVAILETQLEEAARMNETLNTQIRGLKNQTTTAPTSVSSELVTENAELKERVQEYLRYLAQAKQTIETLQTDKNNAIAERGSSAFFHSMSRGPSC